MENWRVTSLIEFLGREWNFIDVSTLITVIFSHCLALFSLLSPFSSPGGAFWLSLALYFLLSLGITLGYHRNLAHRSLKLPKWLEYFFAYCGVLTLQGSPVDWVSTHRYHHQFTDTKKDPHSPIMGLWFSHIGWIFNYRLRFESYERQLRNAADLRRQAYIGFSIVLTYYIQLLLEFYFML